MKRRIHRLMRAVAVAGATALALAVPAANAEAVPNSRCPEGYVCFWSGDNFTGTMTVYKDPKNHTCSAITPGVRSWSGSYSVAIQVTSGGTPRRDQRLASR